MSNPVDQKTANRLEILKAATLSLMVLGGGLAMVLLAWVHDGPYTQLIMQDMPSIVLGGMAFLGLGKLADAAQAVLQAKYALAAPPATPSPTPTTPTP